MRRPGRRNARGARRAPATGSWDPSQLADLEAWYDPGSYAGGVALDLSGNGRDLSAVDTAPVVESVDGALAWLFDGTGRLAGAFEVTLPQPLTVYMVHKASTTSGINMLWDGYTGTSHRARAYTSSSARNINGGTLLSGSVPSADVVELWCATYNGASSSLHVDNMASPVISGDAGSTQGLAGITIGTDLSGGNVYAGHIFGALVCSTAHDADTRKKVGDYYSARIPGLNIIT